MGPNNSTIYPPTQYLHTIYQHFIVINHTVSAFLNIIKFDIQILWCMWYEFQCIPAYIQWRKRLIHIKPPSYSNKNLLSNSQLMQIIFFWSWKRSTKINHHQGHVRSANWTSFFYSNIKARGRIFEREILHLIFFSTTSIWPNEFIVETIELHYIFF